MREVISLILNKLYFLVSVLTCIEKQIFHHRLNNYFKCFPLCSVFIYSEYMNLNHSSLVCDESTIALVLLHFLYMNCLELQHQMGYHVSANLTFANQSISLNL